MQPRIHDPDHKHIESDSTKSPELPIAVVKRNVAVCIVAQIVILITYSVLGMFLFYSLEEQPALTQENRYKAMCVNVSDRMTEDFHKILDNPPPDNNSIRHHATLAFTEALKDLEKCLDHVKDRQGLISHIQSYMDALLYASTIYTTVGYGRILAVTTNGRILTMLYAIFGIPIYTALISDLGVCFGRNLINIVVWVRNHCQPPANGLNTIGRFMIFVAAAFAACTFTSVVIFVCELYMQHDWYLMDAVYFCFSTVSLIGFGDVYASHDLFNLIYIPLFVICQTLVAIMFYFMQHWLRYDAYRIAISKITGVKTVLRADGTEVNLTSCDNNDQFLGTGSICVNIYSERGKKSGSDSTHAHSSK